MAVSLSVAHFKFASNTYYFSFLFMYARLMEGVQTINRTPTKVSATDCNASEMILIYPENLAIMYFSVPTSNLSRKSQHLHRDVMIFCHGVSHLYLTFATCLCLYQIRKDI